MTSLSFALFEKVFDHLRAGITQGTSVPHNELLIEPYRL